MSETLEERLKKSSSAFDSLLSLIPSKYYYDDEEADNQWNKRKQSKEQFKRNKKLKFDPESDKNLSVKQVLKKNANNAKPVVIPGQKKVNKEQDKEKVSSENKEISDEEKQNLSNSDDDNEEPLIKSDDEQITLIYDDAGNEIELDVKQEQLKVQKQKEKEQKKLNHAKKELSPEEKLKKKENLSKLKSKLQEKIESMKSKRKAIGSNVPGAPKSREQIIEERRRKNELREKNKKEIAKEEEDDYDDDDDEEDDDSDINDEEEQQPEEESGVLFQNIMFNDGDRTTSDLTKLRKMKKKKGPANRDIKAHLKLVQQKKSKLGNMDEDKKQQIEEKDRWNRLLLQAEGVKVKDDEKMLKKALKNKERQKRKSENQWYERNNNVKKNIQSRLKRREENLQIRKENKGVKRKNQKKQLRKYSGPKAKKSKKTAGF